MQNYLINKQLGHLSVNKVDIPELKQNLHNNVVFEQGWHIFLPEEEISKIQRISHPLVSRINHLRCWSAA